jgi:hypothetical protein
MNKMEMQHLSDYTEEVQEQIHTIVEASHEVSEYEDWYAAWNGNEGYSVPVLDEEDLQEYTENDPLELTMDNGEIVCTFGSSNGRRDTKGTRQVVCMGFPWDTE